MSSLLGQRELESYLWGAATLLRGLVDAKGLQLTPASRAFRRLVAFRRWNYAASAGPVSARWRS